MPQLKVTNEALATKLDALADKGNERHSENRVRLDDIRDEARRLADAQVAQNGRLQKAERAIDRHQWAIGLIGAVALAILVALLGKYVR
jgi:hypothetical protein